VLECWRRRRRSRRHQEPEENSRLECNTYVVEMMIWIKGEKRAIEHCNTQPPNKWIPNLPKSLWTRYYIHLPWALQ
jgi:hypothetical protein